MPTFRALCLAILALLTGVTAGCSDFPGADGRYATHDRGALNRGNARTGLPPTPYNPN